MRDKEIIEFEEFVNSLGLDSTDEYGFSWSDNAFPVTDYTFVCCDFHDGCASVSIVDTLDDPHNVIYVDSCGSKEHYIKLIEVLSDYNDPFENLNKGRWSALVNSLPIQK